MAKSVVLRAELRGESGEDTSWRGVTPDLASYSLAPGWAAGIGPPLDYAQPIPPNGFSEFEEMLGQAAWRLPAPQL